MMFSEKVPIVIVGNKMDLAEGTYFYRQVEKREAQVLNRTWSDYAFYEISAKNYFDVQNVIHKCIQTIEDFEKKKNANDKCRLM